MGLECQLQNEKAPETGCITMRIYLMSLNCTLKMVKMVNFSYMYFGTT